MKIACITTVRIPAHTANSVQVMKACAALAEIGHEVRLWLPQGANPADISDPQTFYGLSTPVPVTYLPARSRFKRYDFCWQAVAETRRWGADAVYTWALQAGIFALMRHVPVLLEMHGPPEGALGPQLFRLLLALPGQKRLLPISQALLERLDVRYPVGRVSSQISPNGVELARFADLPAPAAARSALGLPQRPTVGYTGHFYAGRGMDLMLDLARRLPEVQFLWVGGRPAEIDNWQRILSEQGLANVILTGYIDNQRLPQYQAAADILIMPYGRTITGSGGGDSAAYCSPMKMFEYMACERPILSSDLPVIGEVLNKTNAILLPPENVDAWQDAIQSLLADPIRCEHLSTQARMDVERYTWQERARQALENFI